MSTFCLPDDSVVSASILAAWLAGLKRLCQQCPHWYDMIAPSQCSASQLKSPCHCCKQGTTSTGPASRCPSGTSLRIGAAAGRHHSWFRSGGCSDCLLTSLCHVSCSRSAPAHLTQQYCACVHKEICLLHALTAKVRAPPTLHATMTHGCICSSISFHGSIEQLSCHHEPDMGSHDLHCCVLPILPLSPQNSFLRPVLLPVQLHQQPWRQHILLCWAGALDHLGRMVPPPLP